MVPSLRAGAVAALQTTAEDDKAEAILERELGMLVELFERGGNREFLLEW